MTRSKFIKNVLFFSVPMFQGVCCWESSMLGVAIWCSRSFSTGRAHCRHCSWCAGLVPYLILSLPFEQLGLQSNNLKIEVNGQITGILSVMHFCN